MTIYPAIFPGAGVANTGQIATALRYSSPKKTTVEQHALPFFRPAQKGSFVAAEDADEVITLGECSARCADRIHHIGWGLSGK
jgi:uncharacterized metal-binding protein